MCLEGSRLLGLGGAVVAAAVGGHGLEHLLQHGDLGSAGSECEEGPHSLYIDFRRKRCIPILNWASFPFVVC